MSIHLKFSSHKSSLENCWYMSSKNITWNTSCQIKLHFIQLLTEHSNNTWLLQQKRALSWPFLTYFVSINLDIWVVAKNRLFSQWNRWNLQRWPGEKCHKPWPLPQMQNEWNMDLHWKVHFCLICPTQNWDFQQQHTRTCLAQCNHKLMTLSLLKVKFKRAFLAYYWTFFMHLCLILWFWCLLI